MAARGDFIPTRADLTTADGLRQGLSDIQALSPFRAMGPRPDVTDFAGWVALMKSVSMQCTDGTLLFEISAWAQGLKTREWWLLPPGWPPGMGHSMVEFLNPATGRWQLVDGQHAAVITDKAGRPLDMAEVLRRRNDGAEDDVVVDYGPFDAVMRSKGRGPTTEDYMFVSRLLDQPVVNLRPTGFLAVALRNDIIIGWAVYGPGSRHDPRVLTTKVAALALAVCLAWVSMAIRRSFRGRGRRRG